MVHPVPRPVREATQGAGQGPAGPESRRRESVEMDKGEVHDCGERPRDSVAAGGGRTSGGT
eukprot:6140966-Lingulodinium_polyedra.AAC.1